MYWKMLKKETYSRRGKRNFSTCAPPRPRRGRETGQEPLQLEAARALQEHEVARAHERPHAARPAPPVDGPRNAPGGRPALRRLPRVLHLLAEEEHRVEAGPAEALAQRARARRPVASPSSRMPPSTAMRPPIPGQRLEELERLRPWSRGSRCSSRRSPSPRRSRTWDRPNSGVTASRPSRISAFGTPSSRATETAPRALARLCGPKSGKRIRNPSQWMSVPPSPMLSLPPKPGVLLGPKKTIFPRTPSARNAR